MPTDDDDACAASSPPTQRKPRAAVKGCEKVPNLQGAQNLPGILVKLESGLGHSPPVNHVPEGYSCQRVQQRVQPEDCPGSISRKIILKVASSKTPCTILSVQPIICSRSQQMFLPTTRWPLQLAKNNPLVRSLSATEPPLHMNISKERDGSPSRIITSVHHCPSRAQAVPAHSLRRGWDLDGGVGEAIFIAKRSYYEQAISVLPWKHS